MKIHKKISNNTIYYGYYNTEDFLILHRIDGPACIYPEGLEEWYINGKYVTCGSKEDFESSEEYRKWKLKAFL